MHVDLRVKHNIEATAGLAIANPLKKDLRWKAIREYREERGHAA